MWRFSIIARPSIINKISIKSLRSALKHTDARAIRYTSHEIRQQDAPIREVFSLDDFGLLSARSASMETLESEKTFLDQLLKHDTLTIPTTVDQKEVFGFDQALEMFADGADIEILAEDLSYLEDSNTSIPTELSNVAKEEIEETEEPLFKIPSLLNMNENTAVSQFMIFPEVISNQQFTSQWTEKQLEDMSAVPTTSEEQPRIVEKFDLSLEVLEGMMDNGAVSEILQELKNGEWPEYLFQDRGMIGRSNRVLRFIVKEAENLEEIENILRTFASRSILSVIADDIIVSLTTRFSKVSSCQETIEKLRELTNLCSSRELKPVKLRIQLSLEELYAEILIKDSKVGQELFTLCSRLNFDKSAETFLKVFGEVSNDFDKDFGTWKALSTKYGSTSGVRSFWKLVLKNEEQYGKKRISEILKHCNKSDHPFTTMARIICTFVEIDRLDKALEIFKLVSVSGRHFRTPLLEWVDENNLECVERLAQLIENGMIAERRRSRKTKKREDERDEKKQPFSTEDPLIDAISNFCGIADKKPKKFIDRKIKRKIHRVDEEQLHELCDALQRAWWRCSNESKNSQSSKRLLEWSQRNRIDLDEKIEKQLLKL